MLTEQLKEIALKVWNKSDYADDHYFPSKHFRDERSRHCSLLNECDQFRLQLAALLAELAKVYEEYAQGGELQSSDLECPERATYCAEEIHNLAKKKGLAV